MWALIFCEYNVFVMLLTCNIDFQCVVIEKVESDICWMGVNAHRAWMIQHIMIFLNKIAETMRSIFTVLFWILLRNVD